MLQQLNIASIPSREGIWIKQIVWKSVARIREPFVVEVLSFGVNVWGRVRWKFRDNLFERTSTRVESSWIMRKSHLLLWEKVFISTSQKSFKHLARRNGIAAKFHWILKAFYCLRFTHNFHISLFSFGKYQNLKKVKFLLKDLLTSSHERMKTSPCSTTKNHAMNSIHITI